MLTFPAQLTFPPLVEQFNPYHGRDGRFTSGGGATSVTWKPGMYTQEQKDRIAVATGANLPLNANQMQRIHDFAKSEAGQSLLTKDSISAVQALAVPLKSGQHSPFVPIGGTWDSPAIRSKYDGQGHGGAIKQGEEIRKFKPAATVMVSKVQNDTVVEIDRTSGISSWSSVTKVQANLKQTASMSDYLSKSVQPRNTEQTRIDRDASVALSAAAFYGWKPPQPKAAKAATEPMGEAALLGMVTALVTAIAKESSAIRVAFEKELQSQPWATESPTNRDIAKLSFARSVPIIEQFNLHHGKDGRFAPTSEGKGITAEMPGWKSEALTKTEASALVEYSGRSGYRSINKELRAGTMPEGPNAAVVKRLDRVIAKGEITEDKIVYRGINSSKLEASWSRLEPGAIIKDNGFLSTSTSANVAQSFGEGGIHATIRVPKGTHAAAPASVGLHEEAELVLGRGTRMKVVSKSQEPSAKMSIVLEVLR